MNMERARTIAARQRAVSREVNARASEGIGAAMDEWFADGRVAILLREAYSELDGRDETAQDIYPLFVALRTSRTGVSAVPVEIALAGVSRENNILLWHTEIAPPEHWLNHVEHDDLRDPAEALAAADVAHEVARRINRTPSGIMFAQRPSLPQAMLDTLMEEHPKGATKLHVTPFAEMGVTQQFSKKFQECLMLGLNDRLPNHDPVVEVTGLASLWSFAAKRYA